jgi:glycosyltransferase involved in cell wall biosynthesis
MRTYTKRIGFIMSSEHLKATGGVGQYAKSFIELMTAHNIKVDIITDTVPHNKEFVELLNTNVIYPDEPYSYAKHRNIFMYGDSYNYERMANFREAIIKALKKNLYDSFICNPYETVQVAGCLGLIDYIQVIAYTHLESQLFKNTKNPFLDSVNDMMRLHLQLPGLYIGTQSNYNRLQIENSYHLPIPLPERELLKEYNNNREGVLFIGRWEEGKNPELYVELIKQTGLPARVITSANGAKKFEKKFTDLGITDYKITYDVVGQEKIDFITSCRVAFNPSTVESYGIAFLEQQLHMPTVALENMRWTNNFDKNHYYTCNKNTMVEIVSDLYNKYDKPEKYYIEGVLKSQQFLEDGIFHKYVECFSDFKAKTSNNTTAGILEHDTIKYSDYIDSLGRTQICIDDVKSVLSNRHRYTIIYTEKDTWLSKDTKFVVPEEKETLFEGL